MIRLRLTPWIGAGLCVASSAVGCNFIVGVGDYAVRSTDSDGSSSGETSYYDASTGVDAQPAQQQPDSDGTPDADTTGTCGSSLPDRSDLTFQQLVDACVLAISCDPAFFNVNISQCITNSYINSSLTFECLRSIASCSDFAACMGVSYASTADWKSADNAGGGLCQGQVAINGKTAAGDTPQTSAFDCAMLGGTCAVMADGTALFANCNVPPQSCTQLDRNVHCSASYGYQCMFGQAIGQNCGAIGGTCVDNNEGILCYPRGAACATAAGTSSCEGTTLESCDSTNQLFSYDCSAAGEICETLTPTTAHCVSPGCSPPQCSDADEGCNGSHTLMVCVGGARHYIDCTTYGFSQCTVQPNTWTNVQYAWCHN
jgi:hypothetical protein